MGEEIEELQDIPDDARIGGFTPEFMDVNGITTRYYDIGTGEPIVLIHGGTWKGYASANAWSLTFDHLKDKCRIIAFDRIGCGLTDNPGHPNEFTFDTDVTHAFGVLDELEIASCHLVGFSRGAGLATRMAVETPERFHTLIINNSQTLGPPVTDNAYRRSRLFLMDRLGLDPTDPEYVRHFYEQYSYQTAFITDERCRIAAYMQSQPKFERASSILREQHHGQTWEDSLKDHMRTTHQAITKGMLTMPVLYIYGINDLTVPVEMSITMFQFLAKHNPDARMNILNKCGHMSFLEHPEEFSEIVSRFIVRPGVDDR